jgi:hypothetical protein
MVSEAVWQQKMADECSLRAVGKAEKNSPFLTNHFTKDNNPSILKTGLAPVFLFFTMSYMNSSGTNSLFPL